MYNFPASYVRPIHCTKAVGSAQIWSEKPSCCCNLMPTPTILQESSDCVRPIWKVGGATTCISMEDQVFVPVSCLSTQKLGKHWKHCELCHFTTGTCKKRWKQALLTTNQLRTRCIVASEEHVIICVCLTSCWEEQQYAGRDMSCKSPLTIRVHRVLKHTPSLLHWALFISLCLTKPAITSSANIEIMIKICNNAEWFSVRIPRWNYVNHPNVCVHRARE